MLIALFLNTSWFVRSVIRYRDIATETGKETNRKLGSVQSIKYLD